MNGNIREQVSRTIDEKIRPVIENHGGTIFFLDFAEGTVTIRLQGACSGCPSADLGTRAFIEDTLRAEIPEVEKVELDHSVSDDLLAQARQMLFGERPS